MTLLRQKMMDAMQVRGFSVRTHQSYLSAVSNLSRYYHRPPDQLNVDELQAYFLYLVKERGLSGASCRLYLHPFTFGRLRQAPPRRIQSPLYKDYPPWWRLSPTDIYTSCFAQRINAYTLGILWLLRK